MDLVVGSNFNNKATKISKKAHGNTLNDAPAELYKLVDRKTGKIKKIGETTHGERRHGRNRQRRYPEKYLDEQGLRYKPIKIGTKKICMIDRINL